MQKEDEHLQVLRGAISPAAPQVPQVTVPRLKTTDEFFNHSNKNI